MDLRQAFIHEKFNHEMLEGQPLGSTSLTFEWSVIPLIGSHQSGSYSIKTVHRDQAVGKSLQTVVQGGLFQIIHKLFIG